MNSERDVLHLPDIEKAIEYAEYVLAESDQCPASIVTATTGSSNKSKSIHQKLTDLYIEETMKQSNDSNVLYASNLLAKLAKKERLNCMVLSLYPGNEGYSIMLRSRSGVESETMKLPYEESEILDYVDSSQLPPFLLDLLEKAQMNVFYSGCVVCEIRDYRRSATGSYTTQYVLLRPSSQSILRDVMALSCDGQAWSQDELFHLESSLILATEEPLCLEPSPALMMVDNALQYERNFLNDSNLKRSVKKHNQSAMNRKRKLEQAPAPANMKLFEFLSKKKDKSKQSPAINTLSKTRLVIDKFKEKNQLNLSAPETIDVKKCVKQLPEPSSSDGQIFVEEHTMERDPGMDRHMMARISIWQPQLGDSYFGEFYLDYDYNPAHSGQEGRRCRFVIGSRQSVNRYLQQFKDLFTEEGKRQVKIAILKAGQATPTIYYTQVVPPPSPSGAAPAAITINNAQTLMKQVAGGQTGIKSGGGDLGSVAGLKNIPIQLSLSISPSASLANSQGLIATPASVTLSSSVSAQYIASTMPVGTQRMKVPISLAAQHRTGTTVLSSSVLQSKGIANAGLSGSTPITAIPKGSHPTPVQTPPLRTTISNTPRRTSAAELGQQQVLTQQNLSNYIQGLSSGATVVTSEGQGQQQSGSIANISIGNLSNLPPNINIQGLTGIPGVNITNLQGLQQMQVSLAQIAVPITMLNNSLQSQTGLMASGSSTTSMVTMVTALPASSSSSASSSGTTVSSHIQGASGQSSNMLSFPVGLSGLTQLMPVNSKTQGSQSIRTPMPFLQLQGQQGIQLLSLQQQQRGVKAVTSSTQGSGVTKLTQGATPTVPLSTVLTSQQMTALGVGGKPGQQLIQLASGGATLGQHVAIQKGQGGGPQTLQFHSLHLKPSGPALGTGGKGKGKRRTTPTPPK